MSCDCVCKCFGWFQEAEWPAEIELPDVEVTILYRDKIRIFFKNSEEAAQHGYTDYDMHREKDGYIYAFSGLRGDAKQLYFDI